MEDIIDFEIIKKNFRRGMYRYIGSGSSRRVFDLRNGFVVKVAMNRGGFSQNQVEYNVYHQEHSDLFAPILAISEDAKFLIMKKGKKLKNLRQVLRYFGANNMRQLVNNPYFIRIREEYGLCKGDLVRRSSWGLIDHVPVLIDYGFTGRNKGHK